VRLWLIALMVATWLAPAVAYARPVRVRGGARLQAQARFIGERAILELRGRLADDRQDPVEDSPVELRTKSGLDLADVGGCANPRSSTYRLDGGLKVLTSLGGEFCLRWERTPDQGRIALRFAGDQYHGAAELEVAFDRTKAQKLSTVLRFEPRPLVVDLDKDTVAISGLLDLADRTAHASRGGHLVKLFDERSATEAIAEARSSGDGKVRMSVPTAKLGEPGRGTLRLVFEGQAALERAEDEQPITRRSTVRLALSEPVEPTDPGDSAVVRLTLSTPRGTVDGGVAEALVDGASVGSAPVTDGNSELTVILGVNHKGPVRLAVRYVPSSPFFIPGPVLEVEVPVAPPSIALRLILAVLVIAAGVWVTVSWRRSKKLPTLGKGRPMLTPGVHVVHSRSGTNAWKGTVVDAHEGTALRNVAVVVRAPSLEDDGTLLEVVTDAEGRFEFALDARPDGAELVASSKSHAEERKALPAGGTLRIALITRRRALQRRLVQWAKLRGRPYDAKPEPTPAHVRQAAIIKDRGEVETWASAVEEAAFGPGGVDDRVEERVRDLEPGP
jgi:hypothetical protein